MTVTGAKNTKTLTKLLQAQHLFGELPAYVISHERKGQNCRGTKNISRRDKECKETEFWLLIRHVHITRYN